MWAWERLWQQLKVESTFLSDWNQCFYAAGTRNVSEISELRKDDKHGANVAMQGWGLFCSPRRGTSRWASWYNLLYSANSCSYRWRYIEQGNTYPACNTCNAPHMGQVYRQSHRTIQETAGFVPTTHEANKGSWEQQFTSASSSDPTAGGRSEVVVFTVTSIPPVRPLLLLMDGHSSHSDLRSCKRMFLLIPASRQGMLRPIGKKFAIFSIQTIQVGRRYDFSPQVGRGIEEYSIFKN